MITNRVANEEFQISPRFRRSMEGRIAQLEKDAEQDEAQVAHLEDDGHIRRHLRMVFMQRAEALRMRLFLDAAETQHTQPTIAQ